MGAACSKTASQVSDPKHDTQLLKYIEEKYEGAGFNSFDACNMALSKTKGVTVDFDLFKYVEEKYEKAGFNSFDACNMALSKTKLKPPAAKGWCLRRGG